MKRNYMYDMESMPKQQGQEINTLVQHLIEAYANSLVVPFELVSKPRTKNSVL